MQSHKVIRGTRDDPNGERASVPYEQFIVALAEPFEEIWPKLRQFELLPRPDEPLKVESAKDEIVY